MTSTNRTEKPKRCTAYPTVWAAIYGCTGVATTHRWTEASGRVGVREVVRACDACAAVREKHGKLAGQAYQDALRAAQDAAGVADYRYQRATRVNGRPVLVRSGGKPTAAELL